jgi:predicted GH43/DUF377 family glycosyl hydrolase
MSRLNFHFKQKVKLRIKEGSPVLYKNLRLFLGFFIAIFKYKKVSLDHKMINYLMYCKWGEAQLSSLYKNDHSALNPLKLDVITTHQIKPGALPEYFHYNPTLQLQNGNIRVFWRVSAYSLSNHRDEFGRWDGIEAKKSEYFERIATGVLDDTTGSNFGQISQENLLPAIKIVNAEEVSNALGYKDVDLYIEDPRAHEGTDRYLTACVRFGEIGNSFYRMTVIDLARNTGVLVSNPSMRTVEKNWVVIQELDDSLLFLNQSKPLLIDKVNINTGVWERLSIQENKILPNSKNLNGGTPFVQFDAEHYIRVARMHVPIFSVSDGCRINVLVLHNLEFQEVARSKPFIFNKLGIEICNGLLIKDGLVYFSWGFDDYEMYLGRCSKVELMRWFNENLQH